MRFFLDTEFIEAGAAQPIDLISIGLICEDGREFYAVNEDCDWSKANPWVRENVLLPMGIEDLDGGKWSIGPEESQYCMSRDQIALEILMFVKPYNPSLAFNFDGAFPKNSEIYRYLHGLKMPERPEFWGYYSSYDWAVFAQIFGTMMDLPKDFPMYCQDIKQWCDQLGNPKLPEQGKGEHNALADARWNKKAWEFLRKFEEDRVTQRT